MIELRDIQHIGGNILERSTFEQMGGTYYQEGDYVLPNLPVLESAPVGLWSQRRKRYLREHRKSLHTARLLSDNLNDHLTGIGQRAKKMFSQLVQQITVREGITEQSKADSRMEWVEHMSSIRERATEIINAELIFI